MVAKAPAVVLAEEGAVRRFRSAYSPRVRVSIDLSSGGRAKQSFKDECDINVIMRRYEKSGALPALQTREPRFMDCTGFDFHQAQLLVTEAQRAFMDLPSGLRERFGNDPGELMAFLGDERNREEAVKLGLVDPPPPVEGPVPVVIQEARGGDSGKPVEVVPKP